MNSRRSLASDYVSYKERDIALTYHKNDVTDRPKVKDNHFAIESYLLDLFEEIDNK